MYSIIFLHGALLGGWCWQRVAPRLEKEGHQILTPDLPGRIESESKNITLKSHTEFISDLIAHTKSPVILVAHSMSGIIASQLAEELSEKIKKVIYVSAYIPNNGQSLATVFEKHFGELAYHQESMTIKLGVNLTVEDLIKNSFHDCPEDFKQIVRERAVSEPICPSLEKIQISKERFGKVSKAFILLNHDKIIPPDIQWEMIESHDLKEVYQLPTGHAPFGARPVEFVESIQRALKKLE